MIYALAAIDKFNIFKIEIHYILIDLSFIISLNAVHRRTRKQVFEEQGKEIRYIHDKTLILRMQRTLNIR